LQKISLNNSGQDPSFLSDNIARELHNRAGVPTPRVDYATVEVNGRYLGLYVLSEGWNKQFLKRYFSNVKGNFYDFGGAHDIDKPTPAAFGDDPTNHVALEALVAAAEERDHAKRIAQLRSDSLGYTDLELGRLREQ
jgi:spore coat protein CotH